MTHGSNEKPTRRILTVVDGTEYVIELRASLIAIRPKGARRNGPAEVVVSPGTVYNRALLQRAEAERPKRATRRVRRGLLSV